MIRVEIEHFQIAAPGYIETAMQQGRSPHLVGAFGFDHIRPVTRGRSVAVGAAGLDEIGQRLSRRQMVRLIFEDISIKLRRLGGVAGPCQFHRLRERVCIVDHGSSRWRSARLSAGVPGTAASPYRRISCLPVFLASAAAFAPRIALAFAFAGAGRLDGLGAAVEMQDRRRGIGNRRAEPETGERLTAAEAAFPFTLALLGHLTTPV